MFQFNYDSFKEALKNAEQDSTAKVMEDVEKVKVWVEKALTLCLESNTNTTMAKYPNVGL